MAQLALPKEVATIAELLHQAGYACYLVGGALRDSLLGRPPEDYDLVTDARSEQLRELFPWAEMSQPQFGRVLVEGTDIMTMRRDGVYLDGRHPAQVSFCGEIEEDLARRDFTVNAMAYAIAQSQWVDPYDGAGDVRRRLLRVVGEPEDRFSEDHLRMLRAVRFKAVLGFSLDGAAISALLAQAHLLQRVAQERLRPEVEAILASDGVKSAFEDLLAWQLLPAVLPELEPAVGHPRGRQDLYAHCILAAQFAPRRLAVRWAALFHDVGRALGRGDDHTSLSALQAQQALDRLGYPLQARQAVTRLMEHHMFLYTEHDLPRMRRLVLELGQEGVEDLVELRWADRQASSRQGWGRHAERALEDLRQVLSEGSAIPLNALAVNGHDVMSALGIAAGPEVGRILQALHQAVLDEPGVNHRGRLLALLSDLLLE